MTSRLKLLCVLVIPWALGQAGCRNAALDWHEANGYRWAPVQPAGTARVGFAHMAPEKTGITKINTLTKEQITENRHLLNGSGVAIGDADGDGLADIYLCQLNGPNALYKNLGNWRFENVAEKAGVACADQFSTGAVFADIDGDGDLDLIVTAIGGPNACLLNDGTGTFTDVTDSAGIRAETGSMSLTLADVDADGDLDLYIANNKRRTVKDMYPAAMRTIDRTVQRVGNRYEVRPEFREHYIVDIKAGRMLQRFEVAEPDAFYLNDGRGHFTPVSFTDGRFLNENGAIPPLARDWGLSARFQDLDNDFDPDLYVCNDFESPDRIWINDGQGNFRALPMFAMRNVSASSMSIDFSDINRDGSIDFFLSEMLSRKHVRRKRQEGPVAPTPKKIGNFADRPQYMRNSLFLSTRDGKFVEIAQYAGIDASEWSWSPLFLDVDLDGYEDLLIVNGHYYDAMDMDAKIKISGRKSRRTKRTSSEVFDYPPLRTKNLVFRNRGGLTFEEKSEEWGFHAADIAHGMASGDLDNDGDLDVVYNSLEAPPGVYRNLSSAGRILIRLRGAPPNTQGIGAKIQVLGGPVPQSKEVHCGGQYLSGPETAYTFATGSADSVTIEVKWRNGRVSRLVARPNRIYEIDERVAARDEAASTPDDSTAPFFADVSASLGHTHHEEMYDDFARQPLQPVKLSQPGPATAACDVNGDGWDDLLITGGRGGTFDLYYNQHGTGFDKSTARLFASPSPADQTAVLGVQMPGQGFSVFVGYSNFEDEAAASFVRRYTISDRRVRAVQDISLGEQALGPLVMADYDLDGDLDLFAGARAIPGKYPQPASSTFFRNDGGVFRPDTANAAVVREIGLVSGAVFTDIDGDADPDLVLALEWGPVTVLRNRGGEFENATAALGLATHTGWWHGVATGDFNADGKMDIVATNWGLNTKYRTSAEHPLKLYYGDLDRNGSLDIIEARFDAEMQKYVPIASFGRLAHAIPYLLGRMRSYAQFSTAGVEEIFGHRLREARELSAATLAHTVFLNQGDGFMARELPALAQFAPAYAAAVADFDGDGNDDIFLSQNFFDTDAETARNDGGRGQWLRGDGHGRFTALYSRESGVEVFGEQRGAALADFNRDGRVDLAVSQNGARTRLFENRRGRPGLRVRLAGPPQNPDAIGAAVRLRTARGLGPMREVQCGAGYASQNSLAQILGMAAKPIAVWVRWPDGSTTEETVPENISELKIVYNNGGRKQN